MAWSPAERGQAVAVGLSCSHAHQGDTGFGSRVRAELGSGSCSSRGALIGFAVAPVTVALVTLSGEQVASVALVTCVCPWPPCVSLAPVAPRGAWGPRLPGWGSAGPLGGDSRSWALCWARGLFLLCLERGRWRGRDTVLGRGACPGRVLPLPSHSFHLSAGRDWWAAQVDSRDLLCHCLPVAWSQI